MGDDWGSALAAAWEGAVADSANQNAALAAARELAPTGVSLNLGEVGGWLRAGISTAADLAQTVSSIQLAKDAAADARADRELARFAKTADIDLKRTQIGAAAEIGKLKASAELEALRRSFSASGSYSGWIALAAIAGVVIAFLQLRKRS